MRRTFSQSFTAAVAEYYHGEWGFTGTRKGMTPVQSEHVRDLFAAGLPIHLHHGGAFGADTQAHAAWRELVPDSLCTVWPADEKRAAIFRGQRHVKVMPVMDPLERNREIVTFSGFLVATPHTNQEEQRSGTWATIRTALARKKSVLIVWPGGRFTLCRDGKYHRIVP